LFSLNPVVGVREPSTPAMMLGALDGLGFVGLRSRRSDVSV
jgi:hypothetical protein